jgi:hypothetical protein
MHALILNMLKQSNATLNLDRFERSINQDMRLYPQVTADSYLTSRPPMKIEKFYSGVPLYDISTVLNTFWRDNL